MGNKLIRIGTIVVLIVLVGLVCPMPAYTPTTFSSPVRTYLPGITSRYTPPVVSPRKGLGVTSPSCDDPARAGATMIYDWSPSPPQCPGTESFPMIWGQVDFDQLLLTRQCPVGRVILGPNEPDLRDQANMTSAEAAQRWYVLETVCPGRLLVAPAPSERNPSWLPAFRNAYINLYNKPPRLDYLAVHCYKNNASACQILIERYISWAQEWGLQGVYVTEFAFFPCWGLSETSALREARILIRWMEQEPLVAGYFWFSNRYAGTEWWAPHPPCMSPLFEWSTGNMTIWGEMYASEPQ